jgi:hypothetical protein
MKIPAAFLAVLVLPLCGCDPVYLELSSCETARPGPDCPKKEMCPGQCVPVPPFGGWELPALLWFGPALEVPDCPADRAQEVGYEGFADPIDPPVCSQCTCEPPTGECELSSVLTASTDTMCPDDPAAMHTDFSGLGPPGECHVDSLAAGHGLVTVEPLKLMETACKPSDPPPPNDGAVPWRTFARACRGVSSPCLESSRVCVPAVPAAPPGFSQCIFQRGDHACPVDYPTKHVFYDKISGSRGCSACSCEAPKGGACSATVTVFQDGSCSIEPRIGDVYAISPGCIEVDPAQGLGSKVVTEPSYQPGTCEPIGGQPIDAVELTGPSTFCCQQEAEQP